MLGYMDDVSDRDFEAMALRHADKDVRKMVWLIEKFNKASAANENKAAETLQRRISQRARGVA
jgi:hypothetical protein